jgi:hypothetical protein
MENMVSAPSLRESERVALELAALRTFVRESNRIEGLIRPPYKRELEAHADLLALPALTVIELVKFVARIQPGAELRIRPNMNVRVGDHLPPPGGSAVGYRLFELLDAANHGADPYSVHCRYETLHPFMDGNGRSGRAVWLWQMLHQQGATWALRMGFLHLFYYQTLAHLPRAESNRKDGAAPQIPGDA